MDEGRQRDLFRHDLYHATELIKRTLNGNEF